MKSQRRKKSRAAFTAVRPVPVTVLSGGVPPHPWAVVVSGVLITSSTRSLLQRCWQWRHSARARASRPGSRDPRSHVARPVRWSYWQSSQFSCLRCHFECSPVCSGEVPTVLRAFSSAAVGHSGRDRRIVPALSASSPSTVSGGRRGDETADRHSHTRRMDTAAERRTAPRYLAGH
jgi:hypothetical protein